MKLVYVGDLWQHGTCRYRMEALIRLGFDVRGVDCRPAEQTGCHLVRALRWRGLMGRAIATLNRQVVECCAGFRPDLVWFDKPLFIRPDTLRLVRQGGARLIHYTSDNPFARVGPLGSWRLLRQSLGLYDLTLAARPCNLDDYARAGAGLLAEMPVAFDPFHDYPAPRDCAAAVPLAFIGSPYDRRPQFLRRLAAEGVPVLVAGPGWSAGRPQPGLTMRPGGLWGEDYRRAIRNSELCLAFITHLNHDVWAHKSFEIAACGTALLAEYSDHHAALFKSGEEAAFFSSVEDAAAQARRLLADDISRRRMAAAGCRRAWRSGYSNDERIAAALATLDPTLGRPLAKRAAATIAHRRVQLGLD